MEETMDEPEHKTTEGSHIAPGSNTASDIPSVEQKLPSVSLHNSSASSVPEGSQIKRPSTSVRTTDSSVQQPTKETLRPHLKNPSDSTKKGQGMEAPAKPPARVVKTGRRASQPSKGETPCEDKEQKTAPTVLSPGAGKGESNLDMMAKMMMSKGGIMKDQMSDMKAMMGKGEMPKMPGLTNNPVSDMKAKMGKGGGGMMDMMSMMGKGGGNMMDMMSMMGKGGGNMMDMMSMMGASAGGGMPDMMSMMMNKEGGSMNKSPMASMFDCLINFSLARVESDNSEGEEDGIALDIPCQHCSRLFGSQMSLKTHVLVAHDHDDTSVLSIKKIAFDGKGKRGIKDQHGTRRKQSRDCEKSIDTTKHSDSGTVLKVNTTEDLAAMESSTRGIKMRHSSAKEGIEVTVITGVPGMEENLRPPSDHSLRTSTRLGSGISETRKRKVHVGSPRFEPEQSSARQAAKKIRTDVGKPKSDSSLAKDFPGGEATRRTAAEEDKVVDTKSQGSCKDSAKQSKTGTQDSPPTLPQSYTSPLRGRRALAKDTSRETKDGAAVSSGESVKRTGVSRKSRQSGGGTATTSSKQRVQTSSATRRSLRSRKSH